MNTVRLNTAQLKEQALSLHAGDRVILSGTAYTARDAAHKRMAEMLAKGERLPFEINGAAIYYAGPTPAPEGMPVGSIGPTTSARMDTFAPALYDMGLAATIGKGERSQEVCDAIIRNKSVYLCAVGGAGALAAKCIKKCEVIAFDELGCESVKRLELEDFPLTVAIDAHGGNLFEKAEG